MTEPATEGSLRDQYHRWRVIRECHVPDTYTRNGKAIRVTGGLVKAVLLDLASWPLDGTIFAGVEYIAHNTQIPVRTVKDALRVLVEHGLIERREQARMAATKVTTLNWDKIQALSQPWENKVKGAEDDGAPADEPVGSEASPIAKLLRSLPYVGAKLTEKDADTLAARLGRKHGKDASYVAVSGLKDDALSKAAANATNLVAYLAKCVSEQHERVAAQLREFVGGLKSESSITARLPDDATEEYLGSFASWIAALSAGEFAVGDPRREDGKWYIDISQ